MITELFPTPVYQTDLDLDVTNLIESINKENLEFIQSEYNIASKNTDVLDLDIFSGLKKNILYHLEHFLKEIGFKYETVFVTTSWLNINPPGGRHHTHNHPNSLISGVYYLDVPENSGNMVFHKTPSQLIDPADEENLTKFSSDSCEMQSCTNRLFMFPSHVYHSVLPNMSRYHRMGLSFNSFITGNIGSFTNRINL